MFASVVPLDRIEELETISCDKEGGKGCFICVGPLMHILLS